MRKKTETWHNVDIFISIGVCFLLLGAECQEGELFIVPYYITCVCVFHITLFGVNGAIRLFSICFSCKNGIEIDPVVCLPFEIYCEVNFLAIKWYGK